MLRQILLNLINYNEYFSRSIFQHASRILNGWMLPLQRRARDTAVKLMFASSGCLRGGRARRG